MVYVICFTDRSQESHYELSTLKPEDWVQRNPNLHLVYAFKKEDELIYGSQCEKDDFIANCNYYGFKPEEYRKQFKGINGDTLMFVGFIPKNRKYKCRLKNVDTGAGIKATAEYVRKYMNLYPI